MKAYRILFAVLLAATLAQTAPVAAQEQEDHIVVRRRYAVTEEEKSPWYNNITFDLAHGLFIQDEVKGFSDPSYNINIGSRHRESIGTAFAFGYERLYRKDGLLFGPGIHIKWGGYLSSCFDFYAHGQYELGDVGGFMGFNFKHVHPYAGASLGLSYIKYSTFSYGDSICYIDYIHETNGSVRITGPHLIDNGYQRSGIRLYADLDLGFVIDITSHVAVSIAYHAVMAPVLYNHIDFNDYSDEIRTIAVAPHSGYQHDTYNYHFDHSTRLVLQHGLKLSFRF